MGQNVSAYIVSANLSATFDCIDAGKYYLINFACIECDIKGDSNGHRRILNERAHIAISLFHSRDNEKRGGVGAKRINFQLSNVHWSHGKRIDCLTVYAIMQASTGHIYTPYSFSTRSVKSIFAVSIHDYYVYGDLYMSDSITRHAERSDRTTKCVVIYTITNRGDPIVTVNGEKATAADHVNKRMYHTRCELTRSVTQTS